MIQILLLILKICGIALLAILGLLLLIVAVVLFVPVFYRIRVIHNPEKTQIRARVSFLFPFIIASVEYLKKLSYKVRIFGIPLLDSEKPKKEKQPKKKKAKQSRKENSLPEDNVKPQQELQQKPEQEEAEPQAAFSGEEKTVKPEQEGIFDKIRSKFAKVRETISNVVSKIKTLLRRKERVQQIFAKPETKKALRFVWDKLKHLLKHILPRKIKGYVAYGADDPATTGQILGILSVLYARTGQLLTIRPNFVEKQLECDVELKGRIQVFTLLVIAVKVFLNQELKQLLAEVKDLKEIE